MDQRLFHKYRFKFYLNASHSIIINGVQGDVHPHTWEITLEILLGRTRFVEFNIFERAIDQFFAQYQNCTMNDIRPFDTIVPTLENMIDYFGKEIRDIVHKEGGELLQIEGSETPTRSYIISFDQDPEFTIDIERNTRESMSDMMDQLLNDIMS